MAAEKDAKLIEVTLLRQHPNNTRPASVQTSVQSQNLTLAAIAVEKQGGRLLLTNGKGTVVWSSRMMGNQVTRPTSGQTESQ